MVTCQASNLQKHLISFPYSSYPISCWKLFLIVFQVPINASTTSWSVFNIPPSCTITPVFCLPLSFTALGERREVGTVHKLFDNTGYIACYERDLMLYFNFKELINPQAVLSVGDELEFTVSQVSMPCSKVVCGPSTGRSVSVVIHRPLLLYSKYIGRVYCVIVSISDMGG